MWLYEQNYTHAYTITNSYLVHYYVAIITHSVALNQGMNVLLWLFFMRSTSENII